MDTTESNTLKQKVMPPAFPLMSQTDRRIFFH